MSLNLGTTLTKSMIFAVFLISLSTQHFSVDFQKRNSWISSLRRHLISFNKTKLFALVQSQNIIIMIPGCTMQQANLSQSWLFSEWKMTIDFSHSRRKLSNFSKWTRTPVVLYILSKQFNIDDGGRITGSGARSTTEHVALSLNGSFLKDIMSF